jgi:hypothetical protein
MRHLLAALALAISFGIASAPAFAQGLGGYFQLSYDSVSFSKDSIEGGEVFNAIITGQVICIKDLPVAISEADITSRIVAKNETSGEEFTLNPSYAIKVKPFPAKQGDTFEISEAVSLAFPADAETGNYAVIGRLIKAEVTVEFGTLDVTSFLSQEQAMGSVSYTASASPIPTPSPSPTAVPVPQEHIIPWWVWLVVAVAGLTTVINIILYLRRRAY